MSDKIFMWIHKRALLFIILIVALVFLICFIQQYLRGGFW